MLMNRCSNCNRETKNKKYCSRSCSASVNNRGLLRNQPGGTVQARATILCRACASPISQKAKIYCSVSCQAKFQTQQMIQNWIDGTWDGSDSQGASRVLKKYLIEQSGNKCSKCKWDRINPVTNKVPLEINHIDGDAYNNRQENLEVLCPNCHSLTPNYKALNKNGKRRYRKNEI